MIRNLDTALLRAFVAVAETGGMTAAGLGLHLTQAAVSQQIRRLEELFDCILFRRDRRGLTLTDAGERLFGKAKRLLALNDEVWSEMTTPAFTGEVKLGVPFDLVGIYLPSVLKAFSRVHPQVEITLVCRTSPELLDAIASGEVDLALAEEPAGTTEGECLAVERPAWIGGRGGDAYLKRPLPLSLGCDTCAFRPAVLKALRESGIEWRSVAEIGNTDAMMATVQTDLAVTVALPSTVPAGFDILGPGAGLPALPDFTIALHMSRQGRSAAAEAMARLLRDALFSRQRQAA